MKNLVDYIDESLIKSYDTEKLKNALNKKYGIENFHDHKSKSDEPKHNFIYANAIFFPHLIVNKFHSIDEIQNDLKKIDENLVFKLKRNK